MIVLLVERRTCSVLTRKRRKLPPGPIASRGSLETLCPSDPARPGTIEDRNAELGLLHDRLQ
jgi:hypothetical protein